MEITSDLLTAERITVSKWMILCDGGKVQIMPNDKAIIYRALKEMISRDELALNEEDKRRKDNGKE